MPFPEDLTTREAYILDAVRSGAAETVWSEVTTMIPGHTGTFAVTADAVKVEGVRVNVSARLLQHIADEMGCSLLTPRLLDCLWLQRAVTVLPFTRPITSSTAAMLEHSAKIDQALEEQGSPSGIVGTVGKTWTISNALAVPTIPNMAENMGWHATRADFTEHLKGIPVALGVTKGPEGTVRLIQGMGHRHDYTHTDYSQIALLVSRTCQVDGEMRDLLDVFQDAELAGLVSHQGVLRVLRQPGVPQTV